MSENAIPQSSGVDLRPGQKLRLTSLAPLFDKDRHQLYYDLLVRAIDATGTRNIALTGAYGTGKSSVLDQLGRTHRDRIVELSLSTIAPEANDAGDVDSAPSGLGSRTNQIQKEIVKQLLYRLRPESVPRSRFRRASEPDVRRDRKLAAAFGSAAFVVLFGLGLLQPFVEHLLPQIWRQIIAYVLLLALAICVAWMVIALVRGRPTMSASVQAGPATVTLSKQSDTYFDQYLDEIVYFFQVSQRDIIVIEDIDRFDDVQVFDTLRALNGLLNTSEQIGRRIVFVYAIRDSVFEQIGARPDGTGSKPEQPIGDSDRAKATLKRASRTKFFDVIIPVVSFVSADNARDVMSEAMTSEDFAIDPALIRLAARHVADMRMIHNIRNEFEVYRSRLVVPENHIPDISDDLVFAIVLFKNTHLDDFEKIRHRDSTLDLLYTVWRDLVRTNLKRHTLQLATYRQRLHLEATTQVRATRVGRHLIEFRDTLLGAAQAGAGQVAVQLSGPAMEANAEDPEVWSRIAAGEPQRVTIQRLSPYQGNVAINLSFSAEQLTSLLGVSIEPHEWEAADRQDVEAKIAQEETDINFLRHHTWEELCARPQFLADVSKSGLRDSAGTLIDKPVSFSDVVDAALESDLARDLVRHGFLTSHFALYASSYYGNHLGRDAMEYIRRCIEPGIPDASFTMSGTEVGQLLREQGADKSDTADLFSDPSVFNVSILDYLLAIRPAAAATVARRVSRLGRQEQEFLDTYVTQGEHPGHLLEAMAPHWTGVVRYAAVAAPVDPAARPALLNAVLRSLPQGQFQVDREVGQVIESAYHDMDAISNPATADRAEVVLQLVRASGAVVESLEPLNDYARSVAVRLRVFPITQANLRVLTPTGPIALDVLSANEDAYEYALDALKDYLAVVDNSPKEVQTVADPKMFATVLSDAAKRSHPALLGQLVARSSPDCRVGNLDLVAVDAWPFLAASMRTDPTFANTSAYLERTGMDEHLGALLNKHKKITGALPRADDDRREVAIAVLAASEQIPSTTTRVRIAASLKPGTIEAANLTPERGDLVARLLKRRLIADDATAFSDDLMVDWGTLEATIAASKRYATFVSPELLAVSNIPNLLRSSAVPQETRVAVVSSIGSYLTNASISQTRAVARALIDTGWGMPYESLEALRAAGATRDQVIALVGARGEELPTSQLKMLLRSLGGDYARIADGGRGRPSFSVDRAHEYVLQRLVGDTIRQVETDEFKGKGRRLVAPLQQSGA